MKHVGLVLALTFLEKVQLGCLILMLASHFKQKWFSRYKNKRALVSWIESQYFRILTFSGLVGLVEGIKTKNDVLPTLPLDHYERSWCTLDPDGLPGFLPGPPHFPLRGARPGWQMIENDENIDEKRRKKVAGLIELNGDLRFFKKREAGDPLNWMSPLFESGLSRLLTGSTKFYRTELFGSSKNLGNGSPKTGIRGRRGVISS